MVQLRKLAYRAIDAVSDRFDHLVTALDEDVSAAIPDDVRSWVADPRANLLAGSTLVEGTTEGKASRPFSHAGVPLLSSFYFRFLSVDHHIQLIWINPDSAPDVIELAYSDKEEDDHYYFKFIHQIVDSPGIHRFSRSTELCTEAECIVPLERPTGDFVFVLIGFELQFHGTDHHINEVRILEDAGNLTVRFRDKNESPPPNFLWSLQYAYVPSSLFVQLGSSSGLDQGRVEREIPAGPAVLRGFMFDFREDHHLREIGVLTGDGGLLVRYADKDPTDWNDFYRWAVDWGILVT